MTPILLDVNLLIALAWPNHQHHEAARNWFVGLGDRDWATCPITQSGFIRISSNPAIVDEAASPATARELLGHLITRPGHVFWPDDLDFVAIEDPPSDLFRGHRQVTDVYLILLARLRGGRLGTLDLSLVNAVRDTFLNDAVEYVGAAE